MCYSNSSTSSNLELSKRFEKKTNLLVDYKPIYYNNAFLFPEWRIITSETEIQNMQWGLIPHWYKGTNWKEMASKTANARIETAHEKISFKFLLSKQRCIIPSNGFFEWQHVGKLKRPYFIYPTQESIFSMAGIYDEWTDLSTGEIKKSFSIITTEANELLAEIHNMKKRMPLILNKQNEASWLNGEATLNDFNLTFDASKMGHHSVNTKLLLPENTHLSIVQQKYVDNNDIQVSLF
jgi:putative SOS response-associated peptidase YedK